ncbi:MAG: endolytic transglycosylase MltG [Candidatus Accumulibacter sp.]|uniref:endolytic transglycosylase MltG n=1 Tax=Accumulibacter sp. TaxID=2053492 RepID=UPI001A4F8C8F|nr:endolytic transglycosylase MltG [Accumulibacter sp.]MBL8395598.1 endolytic transglycosylase MltG [Accumulibacter sp.]
MHKYLRSLFVFALLVLIVLGATAALLVLTPIGLPREQVDFTVSPGSSLRGAAREMAAAGVEVDAWALVVLARLTSTEASIKAGSYQIARGTTLLELLNKLTRGDFTQAELSFIEGWSFRQLRERVDAHPDLRHDTRDLSEAEIMRLLGAPGRAAEGAFFPDTYLFAKRSSDVEVLTRAYRAMQRHLEREWQARAPGLPYRDADQALILASIIEKETGHEQDRSLVAAVFINRLRRGMPLQTDPTVIYGLGKRFDGNLRKRDLLTDTSYNTYLHRGLPPTPIAMPGLASLQAALHPAASDALYFVARGDGTSQFSRSLGEHNQAVARYQKGGKS